MRAKSSIPRAVFSHHACHSHNTYTGTMGTIEDYRDTTMIYHAPTGVQCNDFRDQLLRSSFLPTIQITTCDLRALLIGINIRSHALGY